MDNIKDFHKKMTEEEILDLTDNEFDSLLTAYESHPKLKGLITEYRETSRNALFSFLQTGLKGKNLTKQDNRLYGATYENMACGIYAGVLKARIASAISSF